MQLDRIAKKIVLENIKSSLPSLWKAKVDELRSLGRNVTLASFLDESGLELDDIYANGRSWSQMREEAGLPIEPTGDNEKQLRRAVGRLLHIDDTQRIDFYRYVLKQGESPRLGQLAEQQRRLLAMLTASLFIQSKGVDKTTSLSGGLEILW